MLNADLAVDTRGLSCPLPLLKLKKALQSLNSGQTVLITASDPASVLDFGVFVEQTRHEMLEQRQDEELFLFLIRKA